MIQFTVSAPGTLYLFGEHAILNRKPATFATTKFRTFLKFTELPIRKNVINIECPAINLSIALSLQTFKTIFYSEYTFDGDVDLLVSKVENFTAVEMSNCNQNQKNCLEYFFYYLVYISYKEQINIKSFHMHLTSEVKYNLGGTSSIVACLLACYFHWSRLQKDVDTASTFNSEEIDTLIGYGLTNRYVETDTIAISELFAIMYGSVAVCQVHIPTKLICDISTIEILLVDSNDEESLVTREMEELKQLYPAIFHSIWDSINAISNRGFEILDNNSVTFTESVIEENADSELQVARTQFQYLIRMHQELMNIMGFSNSHLDTICSTALRYGLSAKCADISGRFAYIWLSPGTSQTMIMLLSHDLVSKGFTVFNTSIMDGGVLIN